MPEEPTPGEPGEQTEGPLALLGGEEFEEPARDVDAFLLEESGAGEVLVVPTAAAFENPRKVVETATTHFEALGASVSSLMVLHHAEAEDPEAAARVRGAPFVYLSGGSPMHLRAVLHGSKLWEALLAAHRAGGVLAASGSGAVVLCNPMIDPRGGAYTVGLGLLTSMAVFPHHDTVPEHLWERAVELRPPESALVGIDEHTAAIRSPGGTWEARGAGRVTVDTGDAHEEYANGPIGLLGI